MLVPSPHVVKSPGGEVISLDPQCKGIAVKGFHRELDTASVLIHVRQVESFMDDVVSSQHFFFFLFFFKFFYLFRHRISNMLVSIQCLDSTNVLHKSQVKVPQKWII